MTYNEFKKQAAKTEFGDPLFSNFGAGYDANKVLADKDSYLRFLNNNYKSTDSEYIKQLNKDYFGREQTSRMFLYKRLAKMVDEANKYNGLAGAAAGLGGVGLTYAGLGLIPKLKNKRGVRLLIGALIGVPTGLTAAHLTGKYRFDKDWGTVPR